MVTSGAAPWHSAPCARVAGPTFATQPLFPARAASAFLTPAVAASAWVHIQPAPAQPHRCAPSALQLLRQRFHASAFAPEASVLPADAAPAGSGVCPLGFTSANDVRRLKVCLTTPLA